MAHECSDCARTFVEERLLTNHFLTVHEDLAARFAGDGTVSRAGESQSSIAARGNTARGSIFALVPDLQDRKQVVEISGEPGNYQTKVVTDYNTIARLGEEIKQVSDKLAGVKQTDRPDDIAADTSYECSQCDRTFSTQAGLDNHLKQVHADDKPTAMKPERN